MLKRSLLVILGAAAALNGAIMLVGPGYWYATVPGVTHTGLFNSHFVLDIGIAFLVAGAGLLAGAWQARFWPAALTGAAFLGVHGLLHVAGLVSGQAHSMVPFELAAVVLPSALAVYAAWPHAKGRAA